MISITRRRAVQALAGAPAILRGARRVAGDKPNLLFLWTDEQRADTMAAYGNTRFKVPNMNLLAARSIVFDRCYDTQPVCTPARSTVLTGLWPHTNGCTENNIPLKQETRTFPELLNDPDYRTAYMGKWHLGDEIFAQHGFQEWISIEDGYEEFYSAGRDHSARSSYHAFLAGLGYKPGEGNIFNRKWTVRLPIEHCKPAFLARETSSFIRRNQARPWVLYVNFLEPHMPFFGPLNDLHSEAEAPVPANYPGVPVEREPEMYQSARRKILERGMEGNDLKTRAGWQRLNRNYAGLCSQVDRSLGDILGALEDSGQADNTIIVFTSDHGEMMGAHTLYGKDVLYEESVRIPLLLRVPWRQGRAMTVKQPVSHVDLVPTLLELMGRRSPPHLPGGSLLPLVEGKQRREGHVFIEWNSSSGPSARAVISPDGWKLGIYDTDSGILFNRGRDPLELQNLYYRKEPAMVLRRLRSTLEAWQQRTLDKLALPG